MRVGAVILAAGAGKRLGGVAKAMLRQRSGTGTGTGTGTGRGKTFLARIVATAREVGIEDAVVVVGPPYGEVVAAHAGELGARTVWNQRPERGMASSIALGFAAIAEGGCEAAWLWPVDHPAVAPATLARLVAALPGQVAVRPVVRGRGGHPPLVTRALWARLAGCAELPGGAREVLAAAGTLDVEVDDAGCVRDVDTAADLEAG